MRWLLFLSRVAFICNVFFLVVLSLHFSNWIKNEELQSTFIIIGYFGVALFNPIVNLSYFVFFIFNRKKLQQIPLWLMLANILFLILQIIYIIYLNDTSHLKG